MGTWYHAYLKFIVSHLPHNNPWFIVMTMMKTSHPISSSYLKTLLWCLEMKWHQMKWHQDSSCIFSPLPSPLKILNRFVSFSTLFLELGYSWGWMSKHIKWRICSKFWLIDIPHLAEKCTNSSCLRIAECRY